MCCSAKGSEDKQNQQAAFDNRKASLNRAWQIQALQQLTAVAGFVPMQQGLNGLRDTGFFFVLSCFCVFVFFFKPPVVIFRDCCVTMEARPMFAKIIIKNDLNSPTFILKSTNRPVISQTEHRRTNQHRLQ